MQEKLGELIDELAIANRHFLLALSGGVDSMVLTNLFLNLGYQFSVAHCNFQLRGEAETDAQFVSTWCEENNIHCYLKSFDTKKYIAENKVGIQEAARELRYRFFGNLLQEHKFDFIVTAHHADDNIETVVFNLLRGTSIKGLSGMKVLDKEIFRPLLSFSREEIVAYAQENRVTWREDASNAKNDYSRNFLRNEILPKLEVQFPNMKNKMLGTIQRLNEVESIYNREIENRRNELLVQTGPCSYKVPIRKLLGQAPIRTLIYELFTTFGLQERQIDELLKVACAQAGTKLETETHLLLNHRNHIVVEPKGEVERKHILLEESEGKIKLSQGILRWELTDKVPKDYSTDDNNVTIDGRNISFPLLLRSHRVADYFYPLGMNKKKKLSRFFIDKKMHEIEKKNQLVIESNKKIIWLVGQRIDNRFRITSSTKQVLNLSWKHD